MKSFLLFFAFGMAVTSAATGANLSGSATCPFKISHSDPPPGYHSPVRCTSGHRDCGDGDAIKSQDGSGHRYNEKQGNKG
jgi:hypothetical protein